MFVLLCVDVLYFTLGRIIIIIAASVLPLAQGEQHWFLLLYEDPECLVQVLVGKLLSGVSDHNTVWVGRVDAVEFGEKRCRSVKTRIIFFRLCTR